MPKKQFDGKTVSSKLPTAMYDVLDNMSGDKKLTKSELVRQAVADFLEKQKETTNYQVARVLLEDGDELYFIVKPAAYKALRESGMGIEPLLGSMADEIIAEWELPARVPAEKEVLSIDFEAGDAEAIWNFWNMFPSTYGDGARFKLKTNWTKNLPDHLDFEQF